MSTSQVSVSSAVPDVRSNDYWFQQACELLAPGMRHFRTSVFAISWNAFDLFDGDYCATGSAEWKERRLAEGSDLVCHPPIGRRPATMVCPQCKGLTWVLRETEDGPYQADCPRCAAEGRVARGGIPDQRSPEEAGDDRPF